MDVIKREIPGWMFCLFGTVGLAGRLAGSAGIADIAWVGSNIREAGSVGYLAVWPELAAIAGSAAVGVLLLIISRAARGAVGEGDGWFFVVSGLYISWKINLGLLCYGLILSSMYGILLTVWGTVKGISVRKKKIPFLPFVSMAGILMHVCQMWQ